MTTTTRVVPTVLDMEDGFSTKIAFKLDPNIEFFENSVTPPGIDVGEKIDMSSMLNEEWRTFAAQVLKTLTDVTINASYNPVLYPSVVALVGKNDWITIHFPNGAKLNFYGYLQSAVPQSHEIGAKPMIALKINPTNRHPTTGVETDPVFVAAV